jgi:eukaryotic-like serine/threonine-protein kinase
MAGEYYPVLTTRERQVLRLIAQDCNETQICEYLTIGRDGLKSHRQHLYQKFVVNNPEDLIAVAKEMGYVLTPRYSLQERYEPLCDDSIQTFNANASSYGYGRNKKVFYRRLDKKQSTEAYQRFINEVRILACIDHPNIMSLLDFGWDEEDHPFFVGSHRDEDALSSLPEAYADSPKQITNVLLQLLNVLAYLHWRGICFNNLESQNILVADGRVFFVNLGNCLFGKLVPSKNGESMSLKEDLIQSDLRSLGVVVYQALSHGQPPLGFEEPTMEKVAHAMDLLRTNNSIDEALSRILERLLSCRSEDSYQSAIEVTEDLLRSKGRKFKREIAISKWFQGFDRVELFGRDDVLGQLESALKSLVEKRQGGMRLIVGETGIGKSVLLEQIMHEAWQYPGVIVSYAKAEQARADDRGYMMWRDVLSKLIEIAELTPDVAQATRELKTLFDPKGNTSSLGANDNGLTSDAALKLFRMMHAGQETNRGLKSRAVLLLLDDLQWMGEDSFRLLSTIHKMNLPVLIVGTCRELDATAILTPKEIANKLKLSEQSIIKLKNLHNHAMLKLCNRLLSAFHLTPILDPNQMNELTSEIADHCKGNPQLAKKFIEMCVPLDGPESLRELLQMLHSENESTGYIIRCIQRLDPSSQSFLTLCGIVGRKFDVEVLRKFYEGEREHYIEDLLYDCSKKGFLVELGNNLWEFEHESVYSAASNLLPDKVEPLYEKVARAFEKTYPNDITFAGQLGDLWKKAGFPERAATYYLQAGWLELSKSAYSGARGSVEKISESNDLELNRLQRAEKRLILHFAYMGQGQVQLALTSARDAIKILGYKIIVNSHIPLPLIKALLKQIWYRLAEGRLRQTESIKLDEFLIAVHCYRALGHSEYFKNNFWNALYYVLEGINLCDEVGTNGRGHKADMYATGKMFAGPLGFWPFKDMIVTIYDKLTQHDRKFLQDSSLMPWICLVEGMYYCSSGFWNRAVEHLEAGIELGKDERDRRRLAENVAIRYLSAWYSGDWSRARGFNEQLRQLIGDNSTSLSPQTRSWSLMFDGDYYFTRGEFREAEESLKDAESQQVDDEAALLRILGMLAEIQLRLGELDRARTKANDFFDKVHNRIVVPFYATEGFFGALEVYFELLVNGVNQRDARKKIKELLYNLLEQPLFAFSKRYPIAQPRSLLYKARYVLITTSKKDRARRLAKLALWRAQELKMPYDEGLIDEFIGTHLCDDNSGREHLMRAFEIFDKLGAIWNRDRVGKRLQ